MFSQPKISHMKSVINSTYEYIKENRPSLKTGIIGAVGAIAAYILINYLRNSETSKVKRFYSQYTAVDRVNHLKDIKNGKVKKIFENLYNLNHKTILNTDLELQKRPARWEAMWNECRLKLGLSDLFANIRAYNVSKKIKKFISDNRNEIYFIKKTQVDWNSLMLLHNFETRIGKRCQNARDLLEEAESLELAYLVDFSEDQSHYFEFPDVMNEVVKEATIARNDYAVPYQILEKLGPAQTLKVLLEQNKPSPSVLPFQTDPFKNAFMQLSIIYGGKGDLENAKKMLFLAFKNTDIKTDNWDKTLPEHYFQFFGKTCIQLADDPTIDSALSNKFLIAAKEYILKEKPSYAEILSNALDDAGLADEATRSRQVAIKHYQKETKSFNFIDFLYIMNTDPSYFISLMNLYAKENMYNELNWLAVECFPNFEYLRSKYCTDLDLSDNQLKVWNEYQKLLPNMNLANTLDAL